VSWYINPEEVISAIRKMYPLEKVLPERPIAPEVTFANENLFGVPILVYGEGLKGQYLRHWYIDRHDGRYWGIEYGVASLYGITHQGEVVPLVILGLPTNFMLTMKPEDFVEAKLEVIPKGYLECHERQLINIDRVMQAKDCILIIDKHDLLRGKGGPVPSELIDRIIEMQSMIEGLKRSLNTYQKYIQDYETTIRMLEDQNRKLQELVNSYGEKMLKLASEVTGFQQELIRLKHEIDVRGKEAEVLDSVKSTLKNVINDLLRMTEELSSLREEVKAEAKTKEEGGEK